MAQRSLLQQLREVSEALEGPDRCLDLCLALVRAKTKETLLLAGGKWDRLDRCFVAEEPETVAVIRLEESQVEYVTWFAEWLRDFREGYQRDISLALCAGDRRGGKTFGTMACTAGALIDVPFDGEGQPTVGWAIAKSYRERDELERWIAARLPRAWYKHQRAPEHRYNFTGFSPIEGEAPALRMLSADDPDSLKQGRCDILLYNEPQKMAASAVKHGLYGTADQGGITVLAANPPDGPDAEWLLDLYEAIDLDQAEAERRGKPEEEPLGAKYFHFASAKNTKIDQPSRRRVGRLARIISPETADADENGEWRRWGNLAYPAFSKRTLDKGGLVGPIPEIGNCKDVTREITERIFWRAYPTIIGGDFQRRPHEAAVLLRVIDWPDGPGPIYWFFDETTIRGDEYQLSAMVISRGVQPQGGVWIADCSGSYQGSERIPGRTSYGMLEEHGWHVEAAETIKIPEKSDHPRNPDVGARLTLMLRLMELRRLRVDPKCEWLIEAFAKCQLRKTEYGKSVPKGRHAHITDAACYPIWRLEPKPGDVRDWDLGGFGALSNFTRSGSPFPTPTRR